MAKNIFCFLSIIALAIISPSRAFAAGLGSQECQPIFGGGQTCIQASELSVNKQVKQPKSDEFFHNIGGSDPRYTTGQWIGFRVTVKNTSNRALSKIKIRDIFPQYIDFRNGRSDSGESSESKSSGSFDPRSRTFSFTMDKLNTNEAKVFFIDGQVVGKDKLPGDQGIFCIVNQAVVTIDSKTSQDNSQFCIEKETLGISAPAKSQNPPTSKGGLPVYPPAQTKKTPETGPEALALIGLIPTGVFGFWLKRKIKLSNQL